MSSEYLNPARHCTRVVHQEGDLPPRSLFSPGKTSDTLSFFIDSCHSEHRETPLDTKTIIAELEAERDRLSAAIAALRGNRITFRKSSGKRDGRKRPHSAATRKKLSLATKRRWAEWRKKQAGA